MNFTCHTQKSPERERIHRADSGSNGPRAAGNGARLRARPAVGPAFLRANARGFCLREENISAPCGADAGG